jgi:hypothetical protein
MLMRKEKSFSFAEEASRPTSYCCCSSAAALPPPTLHHGQDPHLPLNGARRGYELFLFSVVAAWYQLQPA